eukprot:Nk52_evm25s1967 gene=Nk52_evmTU25s1967
MLTLVLRSLSKRGRVTSCPTVKQVVPLCDSRKRHCVRKYSAAASAFMTNSNDANLAHVQGKQTPPLLLKTIGNQLREMAERFPNNDALVCCDEAKRFTYKDLDRRSDELAVGLLELGIERGDRIGVWLPSCSQYTLMQYATAKIGAILVTINPAYRKAEAEHAINLVGCKALVITPQISKSNYIEMIEQLAPEINDQRGIVKLNLASLPSVKYIINISDAKFNGMLKFKDLCRRGAVVGRAFNDISHDDIVNIQFTSGTTGPPKAASLTHKNILNNGYFIGERLNYTENDRICVPVPLYHCFGLVIGNLAALTRGSAVVYPSLTFNAEKTLRAVQKEKCTSLYGVPTHFILELSDPNFDKYDLSTLRTGVMAGSICPEKVMNDVLEKMHMKQVTICYGMTETSPVSFQSNVDDDVNMRVKSVGRIHPHLEAKIVRDDLSTCKANEAGELWVRGYSVMSGYWNGSENDNPVTEDGWMKTGDLCVLNDNGFCMVVGRKKDMIIRGGENIYPREIEDIIWNEMKEVKQISVVGVSNEKFGEEICAVVSVADGVHINKDTFTEKVKDSVRKHLSHYKVPSKVVYMKMEDIPTTVSGKIMKHELRKKVEDSISSE